MLKILLDFEIESILLSCDGRKYLTRKLRSEHSNSPFQQPLTGIFEWIFINVKKEGENNDLFIPSGTYAL